MFHHTVPMSPAEKARRVARLKAILAGTAPAFDALRSPGEEGGQP